MPIKQLKPGQILTASYLNDRRAEMARLDEMSLAGGAIINNALGRTIIPTQGQGLWAEITAVTAGSPVGPYSWKEVTKFQNGPTQSLEYSSTTWTNDTGPLYNVAGVDLTVGTKTWIRPGFARNNGVQEWLTYRCCADESGSGSGAGSSVSVCCPPYELPSTLNVDYDYIYGVYSTTGAPDTCVITGDANTLKSLSTTVTFNSSTSQWESAWFDDEAGYLCVNTIPGVGCCDSGVSPVRYRLLLKCASHSGNPCCWLIGVQWTMTYDSCLPPGSTSLIDTTDWAYCNCGAATDPDCSLVESPFALTVAGTVFTIQADDVCCTRYLLPEFPCFDSILGLGGPSAGVGGNITVDLADITIYE